jgi:hypothetical protein
MAVAWVVVALLEWTAWLDEPHYGRGLPPRYYVPQVALPPPRAVEQGARRYPVRPRPAPPPPRPPVPAREDQEEAPTFETPAAAWAAALGEWPVLDSAAAEDTMIAAPDEVQEAAPSAIVPLPPVIALEETVEQAVAIPDDAVEAEAEPEPMPDVVPEAVPEPVPAVVPDAAADRAPEPVAVVAEPAAPVPASPALLPAPVRAELTVTHRMDPHTTSARRRFRFRRAAEEITVEVDDGPPPDRVLPARVLEQAEAARQ